MATIINAQNLTTNLVDGKITSSAIVNANNVRVHAEVTNATSENMFALVYYFTNDGTTSAPLTDENNHLIVHTLKGNATISKNLIAVNSASLSVVVIPSGTHDGDLTVTTYET